MQMVRGKKSRFEQGKYMSRSTRRVALGPKNAFGRFAGLIVFCARAGCPGQAVHDRPLSKTVVSASPTGGLETFFAPSDASA